MKRLLTCLVLLGVLGATPALADETAREEVTVPAAAESPTPTERMEAMEIGPPQEASWDATIADWNHRNPWRYGTDYLFPLTRGYGARGMHLGLRVPLMLVTVPLDLAQLPFGVIAGLFGD